MTARPVLDEKVRQLSRGERFKRWRDLNRGGYVWPETGDREMTHFKRAGIDVFTDDQATMDRKSAALFEKGNRYQRDYFVFVFGAASLYAYLLFTGGLK